MATNEINIDFLPQFEPLFVRNGKYRHKVFYGGRAGTKSHSIARALVLIARDEPVRILCAREIQNSIKDSVKLLLEDILEAYTKSGIFTYDDYISVNNEIHFLKSGASIVFYGLRHNIDARKGLEGIDICWIEEAENISEYSLDKILPTIRKGDSEIWYSFNPESIHSPMWKRFVIGKPPPRSYVCHITYLDNPWSSKETEEEAEHCKETDPEKYELIWLGIPTIITKGSYYGKLLQRAKDEERIETVLYEPILPVNTAWDLGISDSTSIWFFQVDRFGAYRVIDHYSNDGEGLAHYAGILNAKPYTYGTHIAPHDIAVRELGTGKSRLETAASLGIQFDICPNLPIMDGIQAVRDLLPKVWFDAKKCRKGLDSLWGYQREFDEKKNVFKDRPLHNWASHDSDAFRYLAVGFHNRPGIGATNIRKTRRIA